MAILLVVGFLLGVMNGSILSVPIWIFRLSQITVPVIFCLGFIDRLHREPSRIIVGLCVLAAFFWGAINNPYGKPPPGGHGFVVWSGGCGHQNDDLLVESSGQLFKAVGRAAKGDLVQFLAKSKRERGVAIRILAASGSLPIWCNLGRDLKNIIEERLRRFPTDAAAWMKAFLIGEQSELGPEVISSFKNVGLLHLLVLSGSHLSVIGGLIRVCLQAPWHFLYIIRRLEPLVWVKVSVATRLLSLIVLFFYAVAAGLSQSLQRALLCAFASVVPPMLGFSKATQSRIALAIILQAVVFPVNFLSTSLVMSWAGVLILTAFVDSLYLKSFWRIMLDALLIQAVFFVFSLIFFGRVGTLSIPVNLIFQTIFSVLLPIDVVSLWINWDVLIDWVSDVNLKVLEWVFACNAFQEKLDFRFIEIPKSWTNDFLPGQTTVAFLIVALFFLTGSQTRRTR